MGINNLAFKNVYLNYLRQAKLRKFSFSLTLAQFYELVLQRCFYCDSPPRQTRIMFRNYKKKDGTKTRYETRFTYNGVDRIDNTKGYTVDNCVACCGQCNVMKMKMTVKEFILQIRRIYAKAVQCSWFDSSSDSEKDSGK